MDLLFADVDLAGKAGKYVMYVLAVAGGFLIGNLLTLVLCRLAAKLVFKRKMYDNLERALRVIGGIVLAALVAYLLFRFGTGWGFGGSGAGEGDGTGAPTKGGEQPDTSKDKTPPKKVEPTPKDDPAELASGMKVTILDANAFPRSFRFEGEKTGVDLPAAKERLRKQFDASAGKLKFMDLLIYKNSSSEGNPIIQEFEAFAHDLGLRTARKKLDQLVPQ